MTITFLIAIFVATFGMLSIGGMFRAHRLEERITVMRRVLIAYGAVMVPLGVSLLATAQVRPPGRADMDQARVPAEWFDQLEAAGHEQLLAFCVLTFAVMVVAVHAIVLLGSIRSFVTRHSLDLAAREQIADGRERAGA